LHRYTLEERYEELKERLGDYLLLQVYTFIDTSGRGYIPSAMKRLIEKASEINVQEAKRLSEDRYAESLGRDMARHMGEVFSSKYKVEGDEYRFSVVIDECGCLRCILKNSNSFDLDEHNCRAIFCDACLGGYRLSAEKLGVGFEGFLTKQGCKMTFHSIGEVQGCQKSSLQIADK